MILSDSRKLFFMALFILAGILVSGLTFSDFVPSIMFGLLTGLVMALSLVYNLCLLPAMLMKFVPKSLKNPEIAVGLDPIAGKPSIA